MYFAEVLEDRGRKQWCKLVRPIGYHNTFNGSSHASRDSVDLRFNEHTQVTNKS